MTFKVVKKKRWTKRIISDIINPEILQKVTKMSELILKEDALDCFHDWIDRYGYEHTADEDQVYQRIEALDAVRCYDEDCISRRVAIDAIDDIESEVADGFGFQYEKWRKYFCELPAVQPDHNADVSKKVERTDETAQNVSDSDLISRKAAIDAVEKSMYENPHENEIHRGMHDHEHRHFLTILMGLPSAQLDGIPLELIDKHLEWLDNCDNDFAQLAKVSIKAMVELWKKDRI